MSQPIEFKYFKLVDYREIRRSYYGSVEDDLFVSWLFKSFSEQRVACSHYACFVDQALTLFYLVILSTPALITACCIMRHIMKVICHVQFVIVWDRQMIVAALTHHPLTAVSSL